MLGGLLWGGSGPAISLVVNGDLSNYNLFSAAGSPVAAVTVSLTINSGIYLYATTTSNYALDVGGFASGSNITIVNNGFIAGKGGAGNSTAGTAYGPSGGGTSAGAGGDGGPALRVQAMSGVTVSINNTSGQINGGGGGGGGGSCVLYWDGVSGYSSGGGSGGGGRCGASYAAPGEVGQVSWGGNAWGNYGNPGTRSSAGAGGTGGLVYPGTQGGNGGSGGDWGAGGSAGQAAGSGYTELFGAGGSSSGGAAVVGDANITWIATGTRNGAIT